MKKGVFIETENVTRFRAAVTVAEDTERGRPGMVMAFGEAGRGKTLAAENAFAESGGIYLRAWENWTQAAFLQRLCFEVAGVEPHGANRCKVKIIDTLGHQAKTIYVDEADRLHIGRLEDLRDIFDETGCPIVLIGEQGLPAKVAARGRINDRIPREFRVPFEKVSTQDLSLYALEAADLKLDAPAVKALHRLSKGNFRQAHNLIQSLEQMARAEETDTVGQEMVARLQGGKK